MKTLVTGISGQLGYDIGKELERRGLSYLGVNTLNMDLIDHNKIKEVISSYHPDIIIHCAAYTDVDKAEKEPELCHSVNTEGTRQIAMACSAIDAKLVYISTDYVFDGQKESPYDIGDEPHPLNVYGKSKMEGELEVKKYLAKYFIVRTSWAFGIHGHNFVKSILQAARTREKLNVVNDQIGSPTYTKDLAALLCDMVVTDHYGIYHATNEGCCSRAEFADEIIKMAGLGTKIKKVTSAEFPSAACRPHNSCLSKDSLERCGFHRLRNWKEALREYIDVLMEGK